MQYAHSSATLEMLSDIGTCLPFQGENILHNQKSMLVLREVWQTSEVCPQAAATRIDGARLVEDIACGSFRVGIVGRSHASGSQHLSCQLGAFPPAHYSK